MPRYKAEGAAAARARALAFDPARELARAEAMGARILTGEELPELLRSIHDPPLALYALGELGSRHAVAVVGSRGPTQYGVRMARRLAFDTAQAGLVVVSGLARGIDKEAHEAALDAGGTTWAVLGSGLSRLYPEEHSALARRIVERGGCLLSEYPLDMAPLADNFPKRNRLVSGLSWATVVVEGRGRSGSGVTAKEALEQGREVLAVPGPADSPLSEAPLRLLSQGAAVCRGFEDIRAVLPPGAALPLPPRPDEPAPCDLGEEQARILALLGADSLSLDELSGATGLDTTRLSSIMFGLELSALVIPLPGQRYAQKAL
jgi:DNA processing protein